MLWHHFPPKKRSFLSNLFLLLFVCAADGREESSLAKLGFPPHPCLLTLISQPCHPYPSLPPLFLAIISQPSHPCLICFPPHPCLIRAGSHQPKSLRSSITHCKLVTPLVSLPPLFLAIISQHSHPCLIDEKKVSTHCKLVTPLVSHHSSKIMISEEIL